MIFSSICSNSFACSGVSVTPPFLTEMRRRAMNSRQAALMRAPT